MKQIYKITNDINNKLYIGQTTKTLEERFNGHIYEALNKYKDNKPLHSAIRKYGPEHFNIELVEIVPEDVSLDDREQYWVKYYDSYGQPNGYNATPGGNLFSKDVNPMNLQEIRDKVSESQKVSSYWKSEEWREKQRERWSGDCNPAKSEENRKKTSERVRGLNNPACRPDVKEKIRVKATGKKASDETRKKMSENNGRYWLGKKLPQSTIDALSKARSEKLSGGNNPAAKPFVMIDPITNEVIKEFGIYKEAAEYILDRYDLWEFIPVPRKGKSAGVITIGSVSKNIRDAIENHELLCNYRWERISKV